MDLPQIILLLVIIVISVILIIIGVQIIGLLRDAKETMRRLDRALEDVEFLLHNFTRSTSSLTQISEGLKSGLEIASTVASLFAKKTKKR